MVREAASDAYSGRCLLFLDGTASGCNTLSTLHLHLRLPERPDPSQQPHLHCELCGLGAWLRGQGVVAGVQWVQLWRGAGGALRLRLCDGKPAELPGKEAEAAEAKMVAHSAGTAYVAGNVGPRLAARQVVAGGGQVAEDAPAAAAEAAGQVVGSAAQAVADAVAPWRPSWYAMDCGTLQRRAMGEAAAAAGGAYRCQPVSAGLDAVAAGREHLTTATASTFACAASVSVPSTESGGHGGPQASAEQCDDADPDAGVAGPTVDPTTAGTCLAGQQRQQQQQQQQQQAEAGDAPTGRACWPGILVGWIHTRSVVLPRDRARAFWAPEFLQHTPSGEVRPSVNVTLHVELCSVGTGGGDGPVANGGGRGALCSGHTVVEARVLASSGRTASWHLVGVVPWLKARGAKHGEQVVIRRLAEGRLTLRVGGGTHAAVLESQQRVQQSDVSSAAPDKKRQAEVQQEAVPPLRKPWRRPREGCPAQGHVADGAAGPSGHVMASAAGPPGAPGLAQQPLPRQEHGRSRQVRPCPPDSLLVGCVWRTQVDLRASAVTALWPAAGGLLHGQAVEVEVCAAATAAAGLRGTPAGQQLQHHHLTPHCVTLRVYKAKHGRTWRLTGCGALFWELGARNGDAILMWRSPDGDGRLVAGVARRNGARGWGEEPRRVTTMRGVRGTAGGGAGSTDAGGKGDSGEGEGQEAGRRELSEAVEEEAAAAAAAEEEEEEEDGDGSGAGLLGTELVGEGGVGKGYGVHRGGGSGGGQEGADLGPCYEAGSCGEGSEEVREDDDEEEEEEEGEDPWVNCWARADGVERDWAWLDGSHVD